MSRTILRRDFLLGAAAAAVSLALPGAAWAAAKEKITVTGASTIAPLMSDIVRRYEALNPAVQIDVQTGGSCRGVADTRRGIAQIGMVSRVLKPEEADLTPLAIARDGVAMIAHASNRIAGLDDDTIRKIYTGEIVRWDGLSKNLTGPITVVNKAEGRSTLEIFLAHLKLEVKAVKAHVVIGDNEQAVKVVAGNPRALGYVSVGTVEYHIGAGAPLQMLPLGPVAASTANVANGTYVAARPLNLVVLGRPAPHVAAFLSFAASEKVHDLVREHFFVPVAE